VKGFSPPEMHLPNDPDTLYEFVRALREHGYRWMMVQEHTVERLDGSALAREDMYVPNRLVAKNSRGEEVSITVLIKTQGSDTKLVAQMQPYHEAKTLGRRKIGNIEIPCCVTQIADGENGGVMMNEYPRDFVPFWHRIKSEPGTVGFNGTEYLELIESAGISPDHYPICQAVQQHKIWTKIGKTEKITPELMKKTISELNQSKFHFEGSSWTNNLSWVRGYEDLTEPMNQLSIKFHEKYDKFVQDQSVTNSRKYREALLYVMLLETSCFRYWGKGRWTDYAKEICKRGEKILKEE